MSASLSRRAFARLAALATGAVTVPSGALAASTGAAGAPPSAAGRGYGQFPAGFQWGSATASYQVEGAVKEDGRGVTIWDTFSHTPGKTHDGDTGDVADDSYHRYPEDIAVMKELGLKTCRFSIAWSRIFPDGRGTPNQKGLDHYRKFAEALHAAGIEPYCTLYHWDLPQVLEDKGGWQNRDTAVAFAEYAGFTAGKLGDVITHWMTVNELNAFIELGYGNGMHAPGLKLDRKALAQTRHHGVLGHGLAVQALRANTRANAQIGIAHNIDATTPAYEAPEHIEAARKAIVEENAFYLTPIMRGHYTDLYLSTLGADAPKFTPDDMKAISSKLDFVGLNIYGPRFVRAAANAKGYEIVEFPASYPHMFSDWLKMGPEVLYWVPKLVHEVYGANAIYITENGTSSADVVAPDGEIYDQDRVVYLHSYLTQLQRATSEGVPVKGYFLWSLLDNYEWADGYEKRFGITYVDFKTQKRTPKMSAKFYKRVIERNALS